METWIEETVERTIDRLDRRYLRGDITAAQYQDGITEISRWAEDEYRRAQYGRHHFGYDEVQA